MRQLRPEGLDRDAILPDISLGDVLRDVFAKMRRRWRLIFSFVTVAIVLAVLHVLTSTAVFTANGALLIDPRTGQDPGSQGPVSSAVLMSDALTVDSELRVLTSREVTGVTVQTLNIVPAEPERSPLRQWVGEILALAMPAPEPGPVSAMSTDMQEARRLEVIRRDFMRNMRVVRAGDTFVIDLAYTSPDREFAAEAVNTLMREYLRLSGLQRTSNIERNRSWLSTRIEELGREVEESETAVADYRQTYDLLAPEGQQLPTEVAIGAAIEEMVGLRSQVMAMEIQLGQLSEQIAAQDINAVQIDPEERTQALAEFQARYAELQQEERNLLLGWDETAPVVLNVRQQLALTRDLILEEYGTIVERLRARGDGLARQLTATERVIAELRSEYGEDARRVVDLRSLEREAESKRALYEDLLQEFNTASQLLTFDATSARVIAWAVPPDRKSAPQGRQILVLAVLGSLILALGTIFLIESIDGTFRRQEEVTDTLKLPFLGVIPSFRSERAGGLVGGLLHGGRGAPPKHTALKKLNRAARRLYFATRNPTSVTADTMRMLHGKLALHHDSISQGRGGVVIGFTSATHGEGKTTTAANFAALVAQRKESVALIDLDLVTRRLAALLGPVVPSSNDLSRLLQIGEAAIDELAGTPAISPTLTVVTAKQGSVDYSIAPRDVELLNVLIADLRRRFDYIIIDLPPLQGTADTQLFATLCDRLIYLVRWGQTPREQAANALRQRGLNRAQVMGALFTQAPLRSYRSYNKYEGTEYYV